MNKVIVFFLMVLLQSCQFFNKTVPNEKELLQQELKKINWEQVDVFPTFSECDSLSDANSKKICFYETLSLQLQDKLKNENLSKLFPQLDTISLKVTVFSNSEIHFEPIIEKTYSNNKAKLDSIFEVKLINFPKIKPAQKKGVSVNSGFQIPLILQKK